MMRNVGKDVAHCISHTGMSIVATTSSWYHTIFSPTLSSSHIKHETPLLFLQHPGIPFSLRINLVPVYKIYLYNVGVQKKKKKKGTDIFPLFLLCFTFKIKK